MIVFPPFITRRIVAQMSEIPMGKGLRVAGIQEGHVEEAETAFLSAVVHVSKGPSNPLEWTVQERVLAVAHYLAVVSETGADFALGDNGKLSDYLDATADYPEGSDHVEVGDVGGDRWFLRHLTGAMVEAIERTEGDVLDDGQPVTGRIHWLTGAMAAQLVRDGEETPDTLNAGAYDKYLTGRIATLLTLPESAFTALLNGYYLAREAQHHLFRYEFAADGGILILPAEKEGAAENLPPARFPVRACLSEATLRLGGKP
ncbi:hypothetical protein [Uliginosibacterium sediminicola]|uniref:Uncharacterized protein n=1 Tax=Uliginosibacterium sediminicola TaxID=2024550 RepID=A0ABU9YW19_9RHOO